MTDDAIKNNMAEICFLNGDYLKDLIWAEQVFHLVCMRGLKTTWT